MQKEGVILHKTVENIHFYKQLKAPFLTEGTAVPLNGTLCWSVGDARLLGEEAKVALICIVWALVCHCWEKNG